MQPAHRHSQIEQTDPDALIRAWLEDVIHRTGLKPTPLAKAAGLAPSTLLRALDEENPGSLERRSIEKIVQKFNVPPPTMFGQPAASAPTRASGFGEPELVALVDDAPERVGGMLKSTQGEWVIKGRALELAGYLPGDVVRADSAIPPRSRDIVVAQIVDPKLGTAETILRVYEPPYLVTETADPAARRKPLPVDGDTVSIWGVVILAVRARK